MATNNEAKYAAVSSRLQTKYGPHNQGDVEALRNILLYLNGDEMGWQRAIQVFDQTITSMEITLQKDEQGNPTYDEVPVTYPNLPDDNAVAEEWEQYRYSLQDAVAEARAAIGPPKNYRPTDLQLKEYLLESLRRSKVSKYFKISDDAVLARNTHWTYQQIRQDVSDLADREAQDKASQSNRRPHYDPETIRLRSSNSLSSYSQRTHKSHREYESGRRYNDYKRPHSPDSYRHNNSSTKQHRRSRSHSADRQNHSVTFSNLKCLNCREEGHMVKECPSLVCGECGEKFTTAEMRRSHWGKTHGRRHSYKANSSQHHSSHQHEHRERSASASSRSRSGSEGHTPYRTAYSQHDYQSDFSRSDDDEGPF